MFKQKKGISGHIDWILGIAMFLLAIGSMIVLFKPGVTPTTNADTMINLVQDNFISDTEWTITKQPIFLMPVTYFKTTTNGPTKMPMPTGKNLVKFEGYIDLSNVNQPDVKPTGMNDNILSSKINSINSDKMELFYVKNNDEDGVTWIVGTEEESVDTLFNTARQKIVRIGVTMVEQERDLGIEYELPPNTILRSYTYFYSGTLEENDDIGIKNKYLLIYNKEDRIINPLHGALLPELPEIKACAYTGEITLYNPNINIMSDEEGCKAIYQLGIAEDTKGISMVKIIELNTLAGNACTTGYECVKQKWNFPYKNNFKIKISLPNTPQVFISFPENIVQPENARIYARTISSQILTDDAESIPITITIQAW